MATGEGGMEAAERATSTDAEGEAEEEEGEVEAEDDNEDGRGRRSDVVELVGVTTTGSGLVGREGALASRGTGAIAYRLPREGRMGSTLSLHSGLRRVGIGVCVCVCVCVRARAAWRVMRSRALRGRTMRTTRRPEEGCTPDSPCTTGHCLSPHRSNAPVNTAVMATNDSADSHRWPSMISQGEGVRRA